MKFATGLLLAASSWPALISAAAIVSIPATLTKDDVALALATESPAGPEAHAIERRKEPEASPTPEPPKPWIRTRELPSTTIVEVVTPTIWEGVTFSASPRSHPKTPLPWISLNADGKLKTISPKLKNGITVNGKPEYGTFFEQPVTQTVNLKTIIDGLTEDTFHEEVKYVPEDTEERDLNPIIRCTPDRYFKKTRKTKKISGEPFCTPKEGSRLFFDEVYWVSWYTKYFPNAERVRLHLAYIQLNKYGKVGKRDTIPGSEDGLYKRDADDAFWSSDWVSNLDGVYPLHITEDMFMDMPVQDIMLTVQPDTIDDPDFNLVNGTYLKIFRQPIKGTKKSTPRLRTDEDDHSESALYVAMTIPTILVFVFVGFAIFNFLVRGSRTWNKIRVKTRRTGKLFNRNNKYNKLPSSTYELDRFD